MKKLAMERFAYESEGDDTDLECLEDEIERIKKEQETLNEIRRMEEQIMEDKMFYEIMAMEYDKDKYDRKLAAAAFPV